MAGPYHADIRNRVYNHAIVYYYFITHAGQNAIAVYDGTGDGSGFVPRDDGLHGIDYGQEWQWHRCNNDYFRADLHDHVRSVAEEPVEHPDESIYSCLGRERNGVAHNSYQEQDNIGFRIGNFPAGGALQFAETGEIHVNGCSFPKSGRYVTFDSISCTYPFLKPRLCISLTTSSYSSAYNDRLSGGILRAFHAG